MKSTKRISILGDGGWGTTLAILLYNKGFAVSLWSAFEEYAKFLDKKRENTKFLPGVKIPKDIEITHELDSVLKKADIVILAIPSQYLRGVLKNIKTAQIKDKILISVSKGIENGTLMRMSEVVKDCLGRADVAILSGPTISYEVIRGFPTAAVVSSTKKDTALLAQDIFMTERFRIYTNPDLIGVELGGASKNVIAIAAGISDGLGFGANAKATIMDRGLVEMARLGVSMAAKRDTFWGLSGVGDLITTCMSDHSRNRWFGSELGKGKNVKEALASTEMVVEGVATTKSICQLAEKFKVEMPITKEVFSIIFEGKKPMEALNSLMTRRAKPEIEEDVL